MSAPASRSTAGARSRSSARRGGTPRPEGRFTGRTPVPRRSPRRHELERDTPLVALAAAREVVAEAARWLGVALPDAQAVWLAGRARTCYARSASFRAKLARRGGDEDREALYAYLRHWLAARFYETEPALFARLPAGYAWGGAEPPASPRPSVSASAPRPLPLPLARPPSSALPMEQAVPRSCVT